MTTKRNKLICFLNTRVFKLCDSLWRYSIGDLNNIKTTLFHLLYPEVCEFCDIELIEPESGWCCFCQDQLPFTYYESYQEPSEIQIQFKEVSNVINSYALLYYKKKGPSQSLIHALKYKFKSQIGFKLGRILAEKFNPGRLEPIDVLLPVPIHSRKRFSRGYNQSEAIALGIQSICNLPIDHKTISRRTHSESQTKKNKQSRRVAVQNKFMVEANRLLKYNHVGLVDDVLTTGATLKEIIRLLIEANPNIRITIFVLGITE